MLTPTQSDRKVTTNFTGGTEFEMRIHEDAVEMVMENLAGLYTDQLTAMLREYATNAIDAHVMAGIDRPIEVTLPKALQPMLRIRDHGIGLDVNDLQTIYSAYGASTKRHSNDFNGMLGFGCKSALAYSDVFNVTSVKDGVKTFCSVSKDEGIPKFRVLDQSATNELNGTVVEVPVSERRDQQALAEKAAFLYSYFEPGSVLVDGVPNKRFKFDSQVDDHTWVTKRESDRWSYSQKDQQSYIVMGNVPYPVTINHGLAEGYGVVVNVPIGAVEFAPSREGLKMHKQATKNTIASIEARLHKHFQTIVQREVDSAPTPLDAIKVVQKWRAALRFDPNPSQSPLKYRGRAIPNQISAGPMPPADPTTNFQPPGPVFTLVSHNAHRLNAHQTVRGVEPSLLLDCIWVKNFTQAGFTPTTKKKMQAWADDRYQKNQIRAPKSWVLTPGEPPEFWTDNNVILDWETDLKPIKLDNGVIRTYGGMTRPTGSYEGWVDGSHTHVKADAIDTSKPIYWHWGNKSQAYRFEPILRSANPNGYTFVYMPGNRTDKFVRDFPQAIEARKGCEDAYTAWIKSLSVDVRKALYLEDRGLTSDFKTLGRFAGRIEDPDIREAIRVAGTDTTAAKQRRRDFRYVVNLDSVELHMTNPLEHYPLVEDVSLKHQDHILLYLNGAYRAYQKGVLKK